MTKVAAVLVALLLLVCHSAAEARYVQSAKAKYDTADGESEWYTVEITFLTGIELNRATNTFDYDGLGGRYAVIFWKAGQASVIKIDGIGFCGSEFTQSCLASFGNMSGEDQQERKWEICTKTYCF